MNTQKSLSKLTKQLNVYSPCLVLPLFPLGTTGVEDASVGASMIVGGLFALLIFIVTTLFLIASIVMGNALIEAKMREHDSIQVFVRRKRIY